jgi:hypothetical protein
MLQLLEQRAADQLEAQLGWPLFTEGDDRLGWLLNFTTVRMQISSCMCIRGTAAACCEWCLTQQRMWHVMRLRRLTRSGV